MSRAIRTYPKKKGGYRGTAERWGVSKSVKNIDKLLLVHGTGKSGTKSFTKMLSSVGLKVNHEMMGKSGTVTHFFHTDHKWYPMFPWYKGRAHVGERRSDYTFEHTFLLVRHPLKTIASMKSSFDLMDFEFLEECGIIKSGLNSKIVKSMSAYYYMNLAMEKESELIVRIEDYDTMWGSVCEKLNMDLKIPEKIVTNRNTGYRGPEQLSWKDLEKIDLNLANSIKIMSRRYGYEV